MPNQPKLPFVKKELTMIQQLIPANVKTSNAINPHPGNYISGDRFSSDCSSLLSRLSSSRSMKECSSPGLANVATHSHRSDL